PCLSAALNNPERACRKTAEPVWSFSSIRRLFTLEAKKSQEHKKHKRHKTGILCLLCFLCSISLLAVPLTFKRLRNSDSEPQNWLTYWGNYRGTHYSA